MSLRRIIRNWRLSPEEAAEYREIREQIAEELPELIARHDERTGTGSDDRYPTGSHPPESAGQG